MAKKQAKNNQVDSSMPEGYSAVTAAEANAWFKPDPGEVLSGELIGRFDMAGKNGRRYYYQVKTDQNCNAFVRDGEKWAQSSVEAGSLVNIDERHALKGLAEVAEAPERWLVFIKCLEKAPIKGGQHVWRFAVGKKLAAPVQDDLPY